MLRRKLVSICLVALILGVTGIALAKAVKVELAPYGTLEPDASGHAILNYAKGADKTEVQVNCWGLTPETEYTVYLNDGVDYYAIGTFTTDSSGDGHLHAKLEGDASGDLPVAVNNTALNATVLISP